MEDTRGNDAVLQVDAGADVSQDVLVRTIPRPRDIAPLEPMPRREWLVTNGLGGYAAGTVAGVVTRRYHGLLVASLF